MRRCYLFPARYVCYREGWGIKLGGDGYGLGFWVESWGLRIYLIWWHLCIHLNKQR